MIGAETWDRNMSIKTVVFFLYFSAFWLFIVGLYLVFTKGLSVSYLTFLEALITVVLGFIYNKFESRIFAVIINVLAGLNWYGLSVIPQEELEALPDYVSWDITMHQWFGLLFFIATMNGAVATINKKKASKINKKKGRKKLR